MQGHIMSPLENEIKKLDRELIARGAEKLGGKPFPFTDQEGTPQRDIQVDRLSRLYRDPPERNKAFDSFPTHRLLSLLDLKIRELRRKRGLRETNPRFDVYEIGDEPVKQNARAVAAICPPEFLLPGEGDSAHLRVKNYGESFSLCSKEPFYRQKVAAGPLCTGFLVEEDVVATAGHCFPGIDVTGLRFVFGFVMTGPGAPVTRFPRKNVYKGVRVMDSLCRPGGDRADWALVKLDSPVIDRAPVTLSPVDIARGGSVYIMGYPMGLPLKYAPGAMVGRTEDAYFRADLSVYNGSSGSPVFDAETHEVTGIVAQGDSKDFRVVENCLKSIIYSREGLDTEEPQCTRASAFIDKVGRK